MKEAQMPCACTIAGSDSGGGAGIQADIKTFSAFDIWGCSVITSITAQNPAGVEGFEAADRELVALQLKAVLDGFEVSAFKTGMLPTAEIIETVADLLPEKIPVVADPVMISTSGCRLADDDALKALKELLIPRSKIVTPNIPEACVLSGLKRIESEKDILKGAGIILSMGAEYVLIKGGHMKGRYCEDYLVSESDMIKLSGKRIPYDVHGSGCSLSSAIASGLANKKSPEDSCRKAKKFIEIAIKSAYISKCGRHSINPRPLK